MPLGPELRPEIRAPPDLFCVESSLSPWAKSVGIIGWDKVSEVRRLCVMLLVYGGGLVLVVAACVLPYLAYLAVRGCVALRVLGAVRTWPNWQANDNGKETSPRRSASICGPRLPGAQPFRRQPRFVAPRPRSVGNDRLGAGAFSRSRTGNVLCRLQSHDRRNARSPERATKFRRRRAANSAGRDDSLEGIDGTARRLPGPASPSLPSAEYPSHLKPHRRAGASVRAHCDGAGEPRKNSRPRIARIAVARTGQRRQPQPESSILRPVLQFQDSGTRRKRLAGWRISRIPSRRAGA